MTSEQSATGMTTINREPEADLLIVRTLEQGGIGMVEAEGDIDLSTAPLLKSALEDVCTERQAAATPQTPQTIALDLRAVQFIDSAGLALLVEIRKMYMNSCNLALVIEKGSQPERVLRLGRFDTFLKVGYSLDELKDAIGVAA